MKANEHQQTIQLANDSDGRDVLDRDTNMASDWLTFTATAYTATCEGCTGFTYHRSIDVRNTVFYEGRRVIAVDPAVVPLGSSVEVRLAGGSTLDAIALDIGGLIDGYELDLLVADEPTAWAFGRQSVELRILSQ